MMFCGHNVVWHTIWQWHRHAFTWKHIHNYITMWNQPINNSTEAGCKNSSVCLHHPTSCQYTHVMAVCCVWCTWGLASAYQSVKCQLCVCYTSVMMTVTAWLTHLHRLHTVCLCVSALTAELSHTALHIHRMLHNLTTFNAKKSLQFVNQQWRK